jgi:D-alanyl-D-alanine carboxypeptidase
MPTYRIRAGAAMMLAVMAAALFFAQVTQAAGPGLKTIDEAALRKRIDALAKDLLIPGVMVLLRTPQGEFTHGYGTSELGKEISPRADMHFRIASNTKTMTAAVIVLLAQEGKLRLDDKVSKHIAGVPDGDRITLGQLISMRSGLANVTAMPELAQSLDHDPGKVWTSAELLKLAFDQKPLFAPGAEYDYCNTNYLLLGLIAEKIEGKPLAAIFAQRFFTPLAMKNSLLPAAASNAIPEPFAHGYMYGGASYALVDADYPAELQAEARAGTLRPNDDTAQNPSYAQGAGGAISTAQNLATWMEALVDGKVFNADFQREWLQSPMPEDPANPQGQKYGYGIAQFSFAENTMYFHGGEMPGYNSFMGRDPKSDMTLVIWSNLTVSLDGKPTANTIMLNVLDEIYATSPLK